jgi:hypothetical protein
VGLGNFKGQGQKVLGEVEDGVAGLLLLICYTVTSAVFTFASIVITLSLHINEKDFLFSSSRLFGFSQLFDTRENFIVFAALWEVYLKSLTGCTHPRMAEILLKATRHNYLGSWKRRSTKIKRKVTARLFFFADGDFSTGGV